MEAYNPSRLESGESHEQRSNHRHDDACPVCGAEPIRFGTTDDQGNAVIRRHCPVHGVYDDNTPVAEPEHRLIADGGTRRHTGGLFDYGAKPATTVWVPRTHEDKPTECPNCGLPVSDSRGPHVVTKPDFFNDEIAAHYEDDELVVFGWKCDRHPEDVVLPGYSKPDGNMDGWTGVKIYFDGQYSPRFVETPEREAPMDIIEERGLGE